MDKFQTRCLKVITPGWIIKPSANITCTYKGIRKNGNKDSALKVSESSESQSTATTKKIFCYICGPYR